MYNIRIKSVPNKAKTGSQLDYSLVDRNTLFLKPNTPVDSDVKNTMGAVPREKANIEAEGGETVVGDINGDGFLEHQTIVGKRHTQGGVPLNVPEGSFIFSDTKKMIIKDPEILAMFGMKPSKKGYTPAEIAKKYNINDYIAILKDPAKDKYSKETAQIMLNSNLKKLGMLALVQESMKGFPDGVPAIAESVMGQMMGGGQESPEEETQEGPQPAQEEMQEQPQQRYGGTQLPKAQYGYSAYYPSSQNTSNYLNNPINNKAALPTVQPTVVTDKTSNGTQPVIEDTIQGYPLEDVHINTNTRQHKIPKIGDVYYLNNAPITISDIETSTNGDWLPNWLNDPSGIYFRTPEGKKAYLTFEEFQQMRKQGSGEKPQPLIKNGRTASSWWTADDNRQYNFGTRPFTQPAVKYDEKHSPINVGDVFDSSNGQFQVIDTQHTVPELNPLLNPNPYVGLGYHQQAIKVKNLQTGSIEEKKLSDLTEALDNGLILPLRVNGKNISDTTNSGNPDATSAGVKIQATTPSTSSASNVKPNDVINTHKNRQEGKVIVPVRSTVTNTNDIYNPSTGGFNIGKSKDTVFRDGGLTHMQQAGQVQGPGTSSYNPDTNTMDTYDASGKLLKSVPYSGTSYNVKNKDILAKAKASGYDVLRNKYGHKINYVPEQTQKTGFTYNPESGFYQNKQFPIGKEGLDETMNMWSNELSNYSGPSGTGKDAWKKDFLNQKGKSGTASEYLINSANNSSIAAGFGPQVDVTQKAWNVPGVKVFNLVNFKKTPTPVAEIPEVPAKKEDYIPAPIYPRTPAYDREGWSSGATLQVLNAMQPRIYRGDPIMMNHVGYVPDYNLLDYSQAVANLNSAGNALNEQAFNTMSGPQAFNASLATTGQVMDKGTGIQSQWNNANVGISNAAQNVGAGIINANNAQAQKDKYQYNTDRQVLQQQYANSLNNRSSNTLRAINIANAEEAATHGIKQWFPQGAGIDNWNRHVGWSGYGRDLFAYDPYQNVYGPTSATGKGSKGFAQGFDIESINNVANSVYTKAYNSALKSMDPDQAKDYAKSIALAAAKQQMNTNTPGYGTNTAANVYSAMFGQNEDNY